LTAVDTPPGVRLVCSTPDEVAAADLVVVLTDLDDIGWDLIHGTATTCWTRATGW
jgi:hypothetical protein